jgi:F0F1-type ATP synthase membrane subunit b/b'
MMRFIIVLLFVLTPMHAIAGGGGEFDLTPFLGFVLNFLILFGGTGFLLRKKISAFFATRAQRISEDLEEAKRLQDEANALIASTEAKLSQLEEQQKEILEKFRKDGESEKARLIV